jgi:uncharacterized membrane protein
MENQIMQVLQNLADKLGVTITYLWGAMIKQAYIDGILGLIESIVVFILCTLGIRYGKYLRKRAKEDNNDDLDLGGIALVVISILVFILVFPVLIGDSIRALVNPDYYAFRLILRALHFN